jgi:hypothetical protein
MVGLKPVVSGFRYAVKRLDYLENGVVLKV